MSAGRREVLLAQVRAKEALARRKQARPLDYLPWLRFQCDVFRACARSKRLLARAGNQTLGKTTAGIAIMLWRCLGHSPYFPVRPAPCRALLIASTSTQSLEIQRKIFELLPRDEIDWRLTHYDDRVGFGANRPRISFKNGSSLRIATNDAGPRSFQGGTYDFVWIDEVPKPAVLRAAERRLLISGGPLLLTLTPVDADASHIEELVERNVYHEVQGRFTAENLVVERTGLPRVLEDGTKCDEAWVAEQRREVPDQWAPILLDGEWRVIGIGAFFSKSFDRAIHVSDTAQLDSDQGSIRWHLGVDYATVDRAGLVATLVQVQHAPGDKTSPGREWVIIQDCVVLPGVSTIAQLVDEVVSMLSRHGLRWRDLHTAYGDNPVTSRFEFKSNLDFTKRLAHRLQVAESGIRPRLLNAKEGKASGGSVDAGLRYIHELLVGRRLIVRSRAAPVIEALETYIHGDKTQAAKDIADSVRYSLKDYIFSTSNPHSGIVLRLGR